MELAKGHVLHALFPKCNCSLLSFVLNFIASISFILVAMVRKNETRADNTAFSRSAARESALLHIVMERNKIIFMRLYSQ